MDRTAALRRRAGVVPGLRQLGDADGTLAGRDGLHVHVTMTSFTSTPSPAQGTRYQFFFASAVLSSTAAVYLTRSTDVTIAGERATVVQAGR